MSVIYTAGSAIKQGVGELKNWDSWKPGGSAEDYSWLIIAGASDPPKEVAVSKRRERGEKGGAFLKGIKEDMRNMEDAIDKDSLGKLHNTVRDLELEKDVTKKRIKTFFEKCQQKNLRPVIYYTGHGEIGSGNWCFHDGTLGIQEIESLVRGKYPLIIADCCFSGHWANYCIKKDASLGFHCLAAAPEFSVALDNPDGGGELTQWMTGSGQMTRPSTEPMYSGGPFHDYPYDAASVKIEDVTDFIRAHTAKTNRILLSQSMTDTHYSAIFGEHGDFLSQPAEKCQTFATLADLRAEAKNVFSVTANKKMLIVYSLENYGTAQDIVAHEDREKYHAIYYRVTSCFASGGSFYLVMTKGVVGFDSSVDQVALVRDSWAEVEVDITKYMAKGMIITGLCYSSTLSQYLLVMTESPCRQVYNWLDRKWYEEKLNEGYQPTLVFHDQASDRLLCVMTAGTKIISTRGKHKYPLK